MEDSRRVAAYQSREGRGVELSIVMPCLNESRTLPACIAKARNFLEAHGIDGEVIVADNGSVDGSPQLARELGATVVTVSTPGYGAALTGGIDAANGKYIIMGDSDDSYDFGALEPFVEKLREGYDLVMGNRFAGGIKDGAMPLLHRYLGNPLLTRIGQVLFKSDCNDFYCGLRGFRKDSFQKMRLQSVGMEFALEMLVKATIFCMKVVEVPTTLSPDGRDRPPHLRRWRDGWRSLRFYLLFCPKWLFWYPGLTLMILGAISGLWLLPGPRKVGGVTFDVHTLAFSAAAVVLGYQSVIFAILAKHLVTTAGWHPPNLSFEKPIRLATLEAGVVVGFLLGLIGLAASAYALTSWSGKNESTVDPFSTMRIVIPSILLMMLGSQTVLSSFYLGLLQMLRPRGVDLRCAAERDDVRKDEACLDILPLNMCNIPGNAASPSWER